MTSRYGRMDEDEEASGLIAKAKNALLNPIFLLLSKPARRAYLTTVLAVCTAFVLLGLAVTAYVLFYWSYIPRIGFERVIHLQFDNVYHDSDSRYDHSGNPYGTIALAPDIASMQRYDVRVELVLPRTPENCDAGNFMLEASMYAPGSVIDTIKVPGTSESDNRLAFSRRSTILPYRSPVVEYAYRLSELHWYLLGWRQETDTLTVVMFEGVEFAKGWRSVPATLKLEVQSLARMQIYSARVMFRARFRGLRWLMYNHRIISAAVFIGAFWTTEMIFAGLAWAAMSFYLQQPGEEVKAEGSLEGSDRVKQESEEDSRPVMSDTERTFPTSSKQQPLRYSSPAIKQEEEDDAVILPESSNRAVDADVEDEDDDVFLDSGLGTSLESGAGRRRDSVRKRRGRPRPDDGPG